jgi:hypothetical protein
MVVSMTDSGRLWRLKAAYAAGYYKTEADRDQQSGFPWQNKTCKDCPFWSYNVCRVFADYRAPAAHTCRYFDPAHRLEAQRVMQEHHVSAFRRPKWFNERGSIF